MNRLQRNTDEARAVWINQRLGVLATILVCALFVSPAASQGPEAQSGDLLAPLRHGRLVLWIVTPDPNPAVRRAQQRLATTPLIPGYQEQTAGSFGQNAGTYGQTAGSVGQTVGSFGLLSNEALQTVGTYGQTVASFGQTAGSVGQNAGDAGQSVGSFGVSTSNLPEAARAANGSRSPSRLQRREPSWDWFSRVLERKFPDLRSTFVDVFDTDLQDRLASVAGTANAPDLLVWNAVQTPRLKLNRAELFPQLVSTIWTTGRIPQGAQQPESRDTSAATVAAIAVPSATVAALVVSSARNPEAARAFYVWLAGGYEPTLPNLQPEQSQAAAIAASAIRSLLLTGSIGGNADPDIAGNRRDSSGSAAVLTSLKLSAEREIDANPILISVRGSTAVVAVHVVGSSAKELGVLHALVVLRKDSVGRWRILHVSPNLTTTQQLVAFEFFTAAWQDHAGFISSDGPRPKGISQAAPPDGDRRASEPDLWWDNLGGAALQVVEWQAGAGSSTPANLFFVPDDASRLQTRVPARFAAQPNLYHWRVWSVGPDGTLILSPWRTLTILPR